MRKNILKICFATFFSGLFAFCCFNIPYYEIVNTPNIINLTKEDLELLPQNNIFGNLIGITSSNAIETNSKKPIDIVLKIFNLFPIKKIKAQVYDNQKVFASGELIGFNLKSNGVTVEGINTIITDEGEMCPALNYDIKVGDRILSIDGIKISSNEELNELININKEYQTHSIQFVRDGKMREVKIPAMYDKITKSYRIGLWVKDEINGVGTLTYILENDNKYGALGHAVIDNVGEAVNIESGNLYECNLIGIEKGKRGIAGSVKAIFANDQNSIGTVTANTSSGLLGTIKKTANIYKSAKEYSIGGRFSAQPGNAQILCEVQAGEAKLYDIEIIKSSSKNNSKEKSMVIRVVDEELLSITGGIVQGMSGSPIIQNGRIVGAVTHVFVNDPTKGYGIYLDWMLEKQN